MAEVVEVPIAVLSDILSICWESGMFTEMKEITQQWLSESGVENLLTLNQKHRLEPRLTLEEYKTHVIRILKIPKDQIYFYNSIVEVAYFMLLVEKNPLIANEARGLTAISDHLLQFMKRG